MSGVTALLDAVLREQVVASLSTPTLTFPEALMVLHESGYTGPVLVQFHEGRPRVVEVPNPVRVKVIA